MSFAVGQLVVLVVVMLRLSESERFCALLLTRLYLPRDTRLICIGLEERFVCGLRLGMGRTIV